MGEFQAATLHFGSPQAPGQKVEIAIDSISFGPDGAAITAPAQALDEMNRAKVSYVRIGNTECYRVEPLDSRGHVRLTKLEPPYPR